MCQVPKRTSCLGLNSKAKKKFIDDDLVSGVDPLRLLLIDYLLDNKEVHGGSKNNLFTIFYKPIRHLMFEMSKEVSPECPGYYNSVCVEYYLTVDSLTDSKIYQMKFIKQYYTKTFLFHANDQYTPKHPVNRFEGLCYLNVGGSTVQVISEQPYQRQAEFLADILVKQIEKAPLIRYRQKIFDYLMEYYKLAA